MLPLLFAQSTSQVTVNLTAVQIGAWFACAAFALSMYRNIIGIQADKARTRSGTKEQPVEIAHPITMKPLETPAMRSDVEEVESDVENVSAALDAFRKHVDDRFEQLRTEASARASSIRQTISTEVSAIRSEVVQRITEVRTDLSKSIAAATDKADAALRENSGQAADIKNLQSADYRHDQSIIGINARLAAAKGPR